MVSASSNELVLRFSVIDCSGLRARVSSLRLRLALPVTGYCNISLRVTENSPAFSLRK